MIESGSNNQLIVIDDSIEQIDIPLHIDTRHSSGNTAVDTNLACAGENNIHNLLQGLQGGTTNERYHLTKGQWEALGGGGGGSTYTFANGLTKTDSNLVKLGGTLIEATTVDLNSNSLLFSNGTSTFSKGTSSAYYAISTTDPVAFGGGANLTGNFELDSGLFTIVYGTNIKYGANGSAGKDWITQNIDTNSGVNSAFSLSSSSGNTTYLFNQTVSSGVSGRITTSQGDTVAYLADLATLNYVPYTGATANVNLGTYGLTGQYLNLNTSGHSVAIDATGIIDNGGTNISFNNGKFVVKTHEHSFLDTDNTVYAEFGNGSNGPLSYFTHLRVNNAPSFPTDVVRLSDLPDYTSFVPYTGAISDVTLGSHTLTVGTLNIAGVQVITGDGSFTINNASGITLYDPSNTNYGAVRTIANGDLWLQSSFHANNFAVVNHTNGKLYNYNSGGLQPYALVSDIPSSYPNIYNSNGSISADRSVDLNGHTFALTSNGTDNQVNFILADGTDLTGNVMILNAIGVDTNLRGLSFTSGSDIHLGKFSGSLRQELNWTGGKVIFKDDLTSNGISYDADYSVANTSNARWIPDKGYVDAKTAFPVTSSIINTVTNKLAVVVGGTTYYLLASTSAT